MKPKRGSLKRSTNLNKFLARFTKKKEKAQIIKISNKRGSITKQKF